MFYKTLAAATMSLSLLTGAAFAQATQDDGKTPAVSGTTQGEGVSKMTFASDNERMMMEENMERMRAFFTDDTMTTMRSEDEVRTAFSAMGDTDRAGIKDSCDRALQDRGSYGTVTLGLCDQIGAL